MFNNTELAAILAKKPAEARAIKDSLPPWVLFFNIGGYEYFPEDRVAGLTQDMMETAQRLCLEPAQTVGKVAAPELLETLRGVSPEPYWKLRAKGGCQDIFFITIYDKLNDLIAIMQQAADAAGYPAGDIGTYIQPIVQGTSCHCEFNLFYDPDDPQEVARVKKLSHGVVNSLIAAGAFFSRPYGKLAGTIINRDAATVAALHKVKSILDPDNLMNPGKLCF
jgi:FAD/FMN-containing dehydrogenase